MESLVSAAGGAILCRILLEALRVINVFGLHIEFGAWRYAAFGLLLVLTLRFAQNGLVFPVIDRFLLQKSLQGNKE
jgi:ABC-type branched-subunit amino acid transport system permease subunit